MSYEKQIFSKGQVLKADDLNKMSEGIVSKCEIVDVDELPSGKSYWKGTTVPNSGTVENVYFNTNLSVEEVVSVLNQLTYTGDGINVILSSSDNTKYIAIGNILNQENAYWIMYNSPETQKIIFASVNYEDTVESIGWQTFDNPIIFNSEVTNMHPIDDNSSIGAGSDNDLISSLFSTTPFEYVDSVIDNKVVYRIKAGEVGYGLTKDGIMPAVNCIIVDELPETTDVIFYDAFTSGTVNVFYDKSQDDCYCYMDYISAQVFGKTEGQWFQVNDVMTADMGMDYKGVVRDPNEAVFDWTVDYEEIYCYIATIYDWYMYNGLGFVRLVNNFNFKEIVDTYVPKEHHLYEYKASYSHTDYSFKIELMFEESHFTGANFLNILMQESIDDTFYFNVNGWCNDTEGNKKEIDHLVINYTTIYAYDVDGNEINALSLENVNETIYFKRQIF